MELPMASQTRNIREMVLPTAAHTCNLHIMIRYEIEKKLIAGEIEVDDLPDVWDDMYEEYLGIRAPNRTLGVLQDIHWSFGAFGYFPTYTLGNLYSAQLLTAARKNLPNHDEDMRTGNFTPLLQWIPVPGEGIKLDAKRLHGF